MRSDFLVVGAGIAGASAGYFLSHHGRVTVLEREAAPGMHATGRSAAVFSEYYGPPPVRELTAASRAFLTDPPAGFAGPPLLNPRGVLTVCPPGGEAAFEEALHTGLACPVPAEEIDLAEAARLFPPLRPGWASRAMVKPAVADIDVDALHQGFLRGIRERGGEILTEVAPASLTIHGGRWQARLADRTVAAEVLVNAAGAWADEIAVLAGAAPCGLIPRRRTAFVVDPPAGRDSGAWPMTGDADDTFYLKPESGGLLVSPADSTPAPPGNARPEEIDVALGIERVNAATTLDLRHVRRAWAGLRTGTPDGVPVIGSTPGMPGFFWLAGLDGYGLQVAPAAGRLLAEVIIGARPDRPALAPARLRAT